MSGMGSTQFGNMNANAKTYVITDPEGKKYVIEGAIKKFCTDNNLAYETVVRNAGKGPIGRG